MAIGKFQRKTDSRNLYFVSLSPNGITYDEIKAFLEWSFLWDKISYYDEMSLFPFQIMTGWLWRVLEPFYEIRALLNVLSSFWWEFWRDDTDEEKLENSYNFWRRFLRVESLFTR